MKKIKSFFIINENIGNIFSVTFIITTLITINHLIQISSLFEALIIGGFWIFYPLLYMFVMRHDPVKAIRIQDENILNMSFFLLRGKEEFYVKVYMVFAFYAIVEDYNDPHKIEQ